MNKQQIEKAIIAIAEKWEYEIPNYEYDILAEELFNIIEAEVEEIERKAYYAGQTYSKVTDIDGFKTYDQWKESQKQEQ